MDEADDEHRNREADAELAPLVVPAEEAIVDAAAYLESIGGGCPGPPHQPRRRIALALFDAINIDVVRKEVTEYRPKAAFRRLFESLGGFDFGDPDGERGRMIQQWDFPVDEPVSLPEWRQHRVREHLPAIAARIEGGDGLCAIAAEYGVSHEMLRQVIERAEYSTRPALAPAATPRRNRLHQLPGRGRSTVLAPEEVATLLASHRAGESMRSLARRSGVSHETIRRTLTQAIGTAAVSTSA